MSHNVPRSYDHEFEHEDGTWWWLPDKKWELEEGDPANAATDWFFIVGQPRTGTTVLAEILNLHPDCYCASEQGVVLLAAFLPITKRLQAGPLILSETATAFPATPRAAREFCEGWRRAVAPAKVLAGEKLITPAYSLGAIDWLRAVFPGARFVITKRRYLDSIASWHEKAATRWGVCWEDSEAEYQWLVNDLRVRMRWRAKHAEIPATQRLVVEFEHCADKDAAAVVLSRVFRHVGLREPGRHGQLGAELCRHWSAIGRWRRDPALTRMVERLQTEEPATYAMLMAEEGEQYDCR